MVLKQLPLTPNGKLDRRALPAPQSRPEEMGEYIAPRTELERTLADIWAQLLRVDQVGVQGQFLRARWTLAVGNPGGGARWLLVVDRYASESVVRMSDVAEVICPEWMNSAKSV